MSTTYSPVAYVHREVIEEQIAKGSRGKVFYYDDKSEVNAEEGKILEMKEVEGQGIFIRLDNGKRIRIDTIITAFGIPGAAFEMYDANVCMDCKAG